jgi:ElaB/YqjD/DUF883 family membrane-anchored ribosome-binding protein
MSANSPAESPTHTGMNGTTVAPPPAAPLQEAPAQNGTVAAFRERFESLLPEIQRRWPEVARHTLEATRGSFDEVTHVIADQTGRTATAVRHQLQELAGIAGESTHRIGETLQPLEKQLEGLLDELNTTLRPRIEKPVRERPLMALGIAAGVGVVLGLLLSSGRRSA